MFAILFAAMFATSSTCVCSNPINWSTSQATPVTAIGLTYIDRAHGQLTWLNVVQHQPIRAEGPSRLRQPWHDNGPLWEEIWKFYWHLGVHEGAHPSLGWYKDALLHVHQHANRSFKFLLKSIHASSARLVLIPKLPCLVTTAVTDTPYMNAGEKITGSHHLWTARPRTKQPRHSS